LRQDTLGNDDVDIAEIVCSNNDTTYCGANPN